MGVQHMPRLRELPWGWGGIQAGDPHVALSFPGKEVWFLQLGQPLPRRLPAGRPLTPSTTTHSIINQERCAGNSPTYSRLLINAPPGVPLNPSPAIGAAVSSLGDPYPTSAVGAKAKGQKEPRC